MKVLVIASEPISADRLRAALGETTDDAGVLVVAPALHPDSAQRHDESIDADALQQRFGLPVQRAD